MADIDTVVADCKEVRIPQFIKRDYALDVNKLKDFIITISGARRAGKTYFMYQLMHQLIEEDGISRENMLYVNLEDDRLYPFSTTDMDRLLEKYLELSDIDGGQDIYLFLDEIQNIENWSAWVRRIHDTRDNIRLTHDTNNSIRLILTGSSSKLLSKELATNLRGRTHNLTIYPISFTEYLEWKGTPPVKNAPSTARKIEMRKRFNEYLAGSTFPQVMFGEYESELTRETLQGYYEVMLLRDIMERYGIRNSNLLKLLGKHLFGTVSSEFSYNKLYNSLKSMGMKLSKNTIIEYINYFEDVFLFFQSTSYSSSYMAQIATVKKMYCVDHGLMNAVSFRFSKDRGRFLENLVYMELRRRGKEVYYHRMKKECDFLVKEGIDITGAIQVSADIDDGKTRKREMDGLLEAMRTYYLEEGLLLTEDDFEDTATDDLMIKIRPVWYWLQKGK